MLVFVVLVEGVNPAEVFLVRDVLGARAFEYGLSDAFAGAGALVGAAVAGRLVGVRAWTAATVGGLAASGLALIVAGLVPGYWGYAAVLVVLTASFGAGNAAFGAMLMTRTPDADRGKVQAALSGLARAAGLVALALGGSATEVLGPRLVFVFAGAGGVAAMLVVATMLLVTARRWGSGPPVPRPASAPVGVAVSDDRGDGAGGACGSEHGGPGADALPGRMRETEHAEERCRERDRLRHADLEPLAAREDAADHERDRGERPHAGQTTERIAAGERCGDERRGGERCGGGLRT